MFFFVFLLFYCGVVGFKFLDPQITYHSSVWLFNFFFFQKSPSFIKYGIYNSSLYTHNSLNSFVVVFPCPDKQLCRIFPVSPRTLVNMFSVCMCVCVCACVCVCVRALCGVQLFATPWTIVDQASLSVEFSRQKYWSKITISYSRRSSWPRDWTHVSCVSCICWQSFTTVPLVSFHPKLFNTLSLSLST